MKTYEVDVLKLYAGKIPKLRNTAEWNAWLRWCDTNDKLDELFNFRYGLQLGMATVQRQGLVTQPLVDMFCRWIGSIEKTMRRILKRRQPTANDRVNNVHSTAETLKEKRKRDADFERFLRKKSY